jgi:hypothetical protein
MSSGAATAASSADILCESCGYTLNGLPEGGNCPECGTPVAESTTHSSRGLPEWERQRRFWETSGRVIAQTSRFYRTLRTRVPAVSHRAAYAFALRHWLLAGFLVALASGMHYTLTDLPAAGRAMDAQVMLMILWTAVVTGLFVLTAMAVTHLATWLTAWEAGWRGYRLPREVVLRGLCYHAAHLLPVAIAALLTVVAYRLLWLTGLVGIDSIVAYLGALSVVTVGGAVYLFWTYWLAMKNMLYANH